MSKINGQRIREARQFKGVTITELARELGCSKQMVAKYENNQIEIPWNVLQKMIVFLKFPLDFFTNYDKGNFKDYGNFC